MSDVACVAYPLVVLLESIQNQNRVTDVSSLQARTLVSPRRPKSFVPAYSAAGYWGPLSVLELSAWLHSHSGYALTPIPT